MINFISQIIIDSGNRDFSPTIIIIIQKNTRVINQPIKKKFEKNYRPNMYELKSRKQNVNLFENLTRLT